MNKIFITVTGFIFAVGVAGAYEVNGGLQPAGDKATYDAVKSGEASVMVQSGQVLPKTNNVVPAAAINTSHSNIKNLKVETTGWGKEIKDAAVQDFEKNTEKVLENDDNIVSADISVDHITVVYKRNAKLFGFIPVAYYHAFTADGKGNISNGKPWWLVLAKDDADTFAGNVQADFQKEQSQLRWVKAPTALELAIQRFSSIANILKARHDASQQAISNLK